MAQGPFLAAPAVPVATGFLGNFFGGKGASSMVMQGAQVLGAIGSYNNQRQHLYILDYF